MDPSSVEMSSSLAKPQLIQTPSASARVPASTPYQGMIRQTSAKRVPVTASRATTAATSVKATEVVPQSDQQVLHKYPLASLDTGGDEKPRDADIDGRKSARCPYGTHFPSRKSNVRRSVDSAAVTSPTAVDLAASADEFLIRGYTPAKKLLNSGTSISNTDSAPKRVPLKAFAEETPRRLQNSSGDSDCEDEAVITCGGKTAYEKTAVIPLGVKKSASSGSLQAMRTSTDSGCPDDKGQSDYDSSNSNGSNDSPQKDSKQLGDKITGNVSAAPKTAGAQSKAGINPEKTTIGMVPKSGSATESTVKSTVNAAAAAAASATVTATPPKQGITVHSSILSRQFSASNNTPSSKPLGENGGSTAASVKSSQVSSVPVPPATAAGSVMTAHNSNVSSTPAPVSRQPTIVSNVNSTQVSNNDLGTASSSNDQAAAKSLASPSSTASKPSPTVYKPKQCNTPASGTAAKPPATTSPVKSSITKATANVPVKQPQNVGATSVSHENVNVISVKPSSAAPASSSASISAPSSTTVASTVKVSQQQQSSTTSTATKGSTTVSVATSSTVPAQPVSAVKVLPKSSVTQSSAVSSPAVGMTPIGSIDKHIKQPAMPVKAVGPKCISVKPVASIVPDNTTPEKAYEGPVITELYASLRLERDTAKQQQQLSNVEAGKKAQSRVNSAGQQTGGVVKVAGKNEKVANSGKAKVATKPRKNSTDAKPAQRGKAKAKRTRSGKKSQVTAVVGAALAQVGDAANDNGNGDATRMVSALAEAISEYESDFESGDDSDSEMMTNPLSAEASDNQYEDQSCSELNLALNSDEDSDDTGDELDDDAVTFDNGDKFMPNAALQQASAHHRRVSEGGDIPSPQGVGSGRKHCRVKSDVTSSIHLPELGHSQGVTVPEFEELQAGSWKAKKHPAGASNKQHAVNVNQGLRVQNSPRFVHKRDSLKRSTTLSTSSNNAESDIVVSHLDGATHAAQRESDTPLVDDERDLVHWRRGDLLGKGAYGKVWRGLTNSGIQIAVKQIEINVDDMVKAEKDYEQIQEEVQLLKMLQHLHIVNYIGTSLEENIVSIFMEYVPGGSIAWMLSKFQAFDEEIISKFTRQLLEAIDYLHRKDIIHRDIKGGNIVVKPDGHIKLIDFGCAKRLCMPDKQTSFKDLFASMKGTPYWMAPEVVKQEKYGTKSDIWSIGCTVFEMATCKPPWADRNQMSAMFAIGNDTEQVPQLPSKYSADMMSFYNACLTRNSNNRLSAADLLSHHPFVQPRRPS